MAGVHSHVSLPWVVVGRPWCVSPTVGTSGGGGLARRATMASVVGAVLAIVGGVNFRGSVDLELLLWF
jgi:hypothetical protein